MTNTVRRFGSGRAAINSSSEESVSQVTLDYRRAMGMVASTEPDLMSIRDRAAEMKKVMKVPDYNVSSERLTVSLRTRPEQIKKGDHPIEVMAKAERARSDPYAKLTDN